MNETAASVENFDLNRHAVIEASAGTGKTYTIEQTVVRLLTEDLVPLEKILIVTFTEKATGELKSRVRTALQRRFDQATASAPLLRSALDNFDQAPIFTIHGFCHRLVQEFALEQGQDFQPDRVHDGDLLLTLLREIQRKDWRTEFGPHLKAVLEAANYNRETAAQWDRRVLEIARKYKPACGHQLKPDGVPDWWRRLDEPDAKWSGQLEVFTIHRLHEKLRDYKRQRGLQSFDDMIAGVEESLDPARNPEADNVLTTLRKRFSHGIVDEFQDTDPLQWQIFRRIFLEGGRSNLFVVGDPKQAIFGFRGADLPTYVQAAREMRDEFSASDYPLDVNWRSEPDLLEALNCVFADGAWFAPDPGIRYTHVHAPDHDKRLTHAVSDRINRAALTMVDTSPWERLKAAHKNYARFVAAEVGRLLTPDIGGPLLTFVHKGNPEQPLNAGHICILVLNRREAEPITQALDQAGIPYSFYKERGLWQSEEAVHVDVLLHALARPEDRSSFRKALLTCFFRVTPADLVRAPDVPLAHPARQLFQTWLGFVENRQWSSLCRSLLEDTGLLFSSARAGGTDRRRTNLRHILAALEQAGHSLNLDMVGLLDWLRDRRQQRETDDADTQPVETGRPKVQIMTVHASKGLEFPIVFLAGGFTQRLVGGEQTDYHDDRGRLVFDLLPDDDARTRLHGERLSEQRRLLYVAMTRAMFKLYVPKIKLPRKRSQYLGPVGTILLPALERACPDKLGMLVAEIVTPTLTDLTTPIPTSPVGLAPATKQRIRIPGPLFPVLDPNLSKRRIVTRSFSSMTKHHLSTVGEGSSFGDQVALADDEAGATDRDDPLRGPVFGDMVHCVLEEIDFAEVGRAATPDDLIRAGTHARKVIEQVLRGSIALLRTRTPIDQLEEACRQQIAGLVWQALRTPLTELGAALCEISPDDRRAEIEFLYPEHNDARLEERFITGFMDLLFRRDGRYYLLDWKTNLLPGYAREHLERSMIDADYRRQYRLYVQALKRWLERALGTDRPFLERFGGVYYLYLRGMNGRDDATGVYFHRPTHEELDLEFVLTHG